MLDAQANLILEWAPGDFVTLANRAALRAVGLDDAQRAVGLSPYDWFLPEDAPAIRAALASLTPQHPVAVHERRVRTPDGGWGWTQWTDQAEFDARGQPTRYFGAGHEVVALDRMHGELERRLEFERLVISLCQRLINVPVADLQEALENALLSVGRFAGMERSFVYLFSDDRKTAKLAYFAGDPDAPPFHEEVKTVRLDETFDPMEDVRAGRTRRVPSLDSLLPERKSVYDVLQPLGVRSYILVPLMRGGGSIGFLGLTSFRAERGWSNEEEELLRLVAEAFVNVMERRDAEHALLETEERLRLTIESIEVGAYDWRIPSGALVVSDHWLASLGLPLEGNTLGVERWRELIDPCDRDRVMDLITAHLAGHTERFEAVFRVRRQDGSTRWFEDRGRVTERGPDGQPLRMLGVNRDITEAVEQHERRRELEQALAHLGRVAAMGETVAGIAHEVNQPLHAASNFCAAASAALKRGGVQNAAGLVDRVATQIERAGNILKRLRDFTRPRSTVTEPFDLNEQVTEAVDLTLRLAQTRAPQLKLDLTAGLPPLMGDPVQVQQVVVNLVQNALDAMHLAASPRPVLLIATRLAGDGLETRVCDNSGAAQGVDLGKMFEQFHTTKPGGMGVGLSLSRSIIERMGGRIWAEVNPDDGLDLVVNLPLRTEPET